MCRGKRFSILVSLTIPRRGIIVLALFLGSGHAIAQCQRQKLTASDAMPEDIFGHAIVISGGIAAVGASQADGLFMQQGSAYVFEPINTVWTQAAKFTASDAVQGDRFGASVGAFGDTVVIGAPLHPRVFADQGQAYVFVKQPSGWTSTESAKLWSSDEQPGYFGSSVAISDDVIVVGAHYGYNSNIDQGVVYVFVKPVGGWGDMTETARLIASGGASGDQFGYAVCISGDTILVGAVGENGVQGAAYIFVEPPGGWAGTITPTTRLSASDAPSDYLGYSVSISGDTLAVGAPGHNGATSGEGIAYVYVRPSTGWPPAMTETAKLTASDAVPDDRFGVAVSISGDRIAVGTINGGGAYLFPKPQPEWTDLSNAANIFPSESLDPFHGYFGSTISISQEVMIVGRYYDNAGEGSAYIFDAAAPDCNVNRVCDDLDIANASSSDCNANASPDECDIANCPPDVPSCQDCNGDGRPDECGVTETCDSTESQKILATDGAMQDFFGWSVSVSADVTVVGAPGDDDNGTNTGSAYVIRWNPGAPGSWMQEQKLVSSDGAVDDMFGTWVSLSGDVAVVGAALRDDNGNASGSVYVFRWSGFSWMEEQKLLASDGAAVDGFGQYLSVSGDVAVVGAPGDDDIGVSGGSAYVFRYHPELPLGSRWIEEQKLLASDFAENLQFGSSVSVSGGVVVVGAIHDDDNGTNSGSAYVFRWNGSSWMLEQKILASDGTAGDKFGGRVSVAGDVAVAAAFEDDDNGTDSGAAYMFRYHPELPLGSKWLEEQKLLASDGAAGDQFGAYVSLSGYVAAVTAIYDDDNGSNSGSAYVFRWDGLSWVEERKLLASDGAADDQFGTSASVSGDVVFLTSDYDDDNGSFSGSAYVFNLAAPDCNCNGSADACDIAISTSTDCNGNGIPDECDIASGTSADCNMNMIPDDCEPQQCTTDVECSDGEICTCDRCVCGVCLYQPIPFGDTNCSCLLPNLDDILNVLNDFTDGPSVTDPNNDICPNCVPDGVISLDDILCVLSAFAGTSPCIPLCSDACLQGACCNGATCSVKSMANCIAPMTPVLPGMYQGNGTLCPPAIPTNPCEP